MTSALSAIDAILDFWFGPLDDAGLASEAHAKRWFAKDPAFDRQIRVRFGAEHANVRAGRRDDWLESDRGWVAQVIVLDQFSRNLYRDGARMFEADERGLGLARASIEAGRDLRCPTDHRAFLYLPLMHSESLADQLECVHRFEAQLAGLVGAARVRIEGNLRFARMHRDVVARFGRFPHRNALLGRRSTREEEEFLREPGSSF